MTIKNIEYQELEKLLAKKRQFIFDFDGTIADTENYHWKAYNECLKKYNVTLNLDAINRYIGHNEYVIYEMIKKDFNISFDNSEFFKERIEIYLEMTDKNNLQPFLFFQELMDGFPEVEYVILSSQKEEIIRLFLKKWEIENLFQEVVSVADQKISKEIVLRNLQDYYKYSAEESVLFEDTNRNLELGLANNIISVGVEHQFNIGLLTNCSVIIKGRS